MNEIACEQCGHIWPEEELLEREDNGLLICPDCSGLLADEDLDCKYDEFG